MPMELLANVKGTTFTLENVPVGEYEIEASSKDGYGSTHVGVAAGAGSTVVIKNAGHGIVEGRVVDSATGQPLAGLLCRMFDRGTSKATTTGSGTFRLEHVAVGRRLVSCSSPDGKLAAEAEVQVAASSTVHVEMTAAKRERGKRSYTGLTFEDELDKVLVKDVAAGSPAERAGIKVGDRVTKLMDTPLSGFRSGARMANGIAYLPIGEKVELTLERDGKERSVELVSVAAP